MLNTVKNLMHRFDGVDVGHVRDLAKDLGGSSADLAKTVGVASIAVAKKIGIKRGLAGFAVLGVATLGGILLARYLRERRAIEESIEASEAEAEASQPAAQPVRRRRQSRAKRKANHAQH